MFTLSWSEDHFKWDGSAYAYPSEELVGEEVYTFRLLNGWVERFTKAKKIDCKVVLSAEAKGPEDLAVSLGNFFFLFAYNMFILSNLGP